MTDKAMNIKIFKRKIAAYGADIARWPDEKAARRLLDESEEARALLEQADRLDRTLDVFSVSAPDAGHHLRTADRVLRKVRGSGSGAPSFTLRFLVPGGALAAAAVAILLFVNLAPVSTGAGVKVAENREIENFLAEVDRQDFLRQQEDRAEKEILALLEASESNSAAQVADDLESGKNPEAAIDQFLDTLEDSAAEAPAPEEDDIWDYFMRQG